MNALAWKISCCHSQPLQARASPQSRNRLSLLLLSGRALT